jgi:hypothetical protein
MEAFGEHYCTRPTFLDLGEDLSEFRKWQNDHVIKTRDRLESNPQLREARAVILFHTVIQRHETCMLKVCQRTGREALEMKCSKRLKLMIAAIEKSAIVSWDIVSGQRLDELINSPIVMMRTKELNKKSNDKNKKKKKNVPDGKSGDPSGLRTSEGRNSNTEEKLLDGCTCLADVGGDTYEEDVSGFVTGGVEFDDARPVEKNDEGAQSREDEDDEVQSLEDEDEGVFSNGME